MVVGASSSVPVIGDSSTTDCAQVDLGTTKGDPSDDLASSSKPGRLLKVLRLYAPKVCFTYYFVYVISYALQTIVCF